MALLLRPGDPLPVLPTPTGKLDIAARAGAYWLLATGTRDALQSAQLPGLQIVALTHDEAGLIAARRLGAALRDGQPEPMVVLVDPAGTVVQAWADAGLPELLQLAWARVRPLAGLA